LKALGDADKKLKENGVDLGVLVLEAEHEIAHAGVLLAHKMWQDASELI